MGKVADWRDLSLNPLVFTWAGDGSDGGGGYGCLGRLAPSALLQFLADITIGSRPCD